MTICCCLIPLSSCNDTEEFYASNEQDRDEDSITGDNYIYHLPVIFHVIYNDSKDPKQYISASRLRSILNNVNELYQGYIYNMEGSESENIYVNFELATHDEQGRKLSTPGVEYIKYNGDYPIDCDKFMRDKSGKYAKYIWDPNEYINVMLYNFEQTKESSTTLGISIMPYSYDRYPDLEGLEKTKYATLSKTNLSNPYCISINSLFADREGTRYTTDKGKNNYEYTSLDVNITLAHEIGHYLGLHHVFAQEKTEHGYEPVDECIDTDYCKDTPTYNRIAYEDWYLNYLKEHQNDSTLSMVPLVARTGIDGEQWNSANLMDYSVSYSFKFSTEQKERMRQVLYYSPLIPGPKKPRTGTRGKTTEAPTGIVDLPIQLAQ